MIRPSSHNLLDTRPVHERSPSARVLAAVTLFGGILQFAATVRLGFAPLSALQTAAAEGADAYLLLTAALTMGGLAIWKLRHRWLLAAGIAVLWQAVVFWPLHNRISGLGLIFHGEALLHHFLALVSIAVIVSIVRRWSLAPFVPRAMRWLLITASLTGIPLLAVAHLTPLLSSWPGEFATIARTVGSGATLALWPLAWVLLALSSPPSRSTLIALAIAVPPTLRIASAGEHGLRGEPVPDEAIVWIVTALVAAAGVTFTLFRPKVARSGRAFSIVVSAIATSILYVLYRKRFGELEENLGGLHQSLFGFNLPYPPYVDAWQLVAVMFAIFFILTAAYSALLSDEDRGLGIALGLLVVSGIGFTTPQLVFMATAGFLLFIDEAQRGIIVPSVVEPPVGVESLMLETATRLGLAPPVVLEQDDGQVSAVRGDIEGFPVQVRVRVHKHRPMEVVVHVGMVGRDRPEYELEPNPPRTGEHSAPATHRVRGPTRAGERIPDEVWEAFAPFPTARGRFWVTGTEVLVGPDVTALTAEHLEQLIRALRHASN